MTAKLGIVAGGGDLPSKLIEICRGNGREVFVVAVEGQTDRATVADTEHAWVRLGAMSAGLEALRAAGVEDLVLIGKVARPSLKELRPDLRTMRFLTKVGANSLGDDGLLRAIVRNLEDEGFGVLGVDEIIADWLAPAGVLGSCRPDRTAEGDIARGLEVALALGRADVGQAAVVQEGIVLGVEAAEGTDALLERCRGLARAGPGGVLVKIAKPGQERRVDLPTLGLRTVTAAAAAGLRGIAVQAAATLLVDRRATVEAADVAGLFLVGVDPAAGG